MVQTKYNSLYLCEIKFSKDKIGLSIIEEIQDKIKRLSTQKNLSVWPVLIHVNGVAESVQKSGFFSKIIDFGEFLTE